MSDPAEKIMDPMEYWQAVARGEAGLHKSDIYRYDCLNSWPWGQVMVMFEFSSEYAHYRLQASRPPQSSPIPEVEVSNSIAHGEPPSTDSNGGAA